ncbi:MAG: rRNA maturation RNase YbeY [Shimia sp.]
MISVDVILEDPRWDGLERLAEAAAQAIAAHLSLTGEVCVMGCDNARIAVLNGEFRGKSAPTNVLSWPSEERAAAIPGGSPAPPADPEWGDIAIAFETCKREAAEQGKPFDHHVTHLIVHGILHLLGYDHETEADATRMEQLEREILANMGISDPYSRP